MPTGTNLWQAKVLTMVRQRYNSVISNTVTWRLDWKVLTRKIKDEKCKKYHYFLDIGNLDYLHEILWPRLHLSENGLDRTLPLAPLSILKLLKISDDSYILILIICKPHTLTNTHTHKHTHSHSHTGLYCESLLQAQYHISQRTQCM